LEQRKYKARFLQIEIIRKHRIPFKIRISQFRIFRIMMINLQANVKGINSVLIISILILLILSGIAIIHYTRPDLLVLEKEREQLEEVRASNRGIGSSLPLYVGLEKGYFEEAGIKLNLANITSGVQAYEYLIENIIDVGQFPIDPIIFDNPPKGRLKIFMVLKYTETTNRNFDNLLTRNDSNISSLKDLEGKNVGIFPGITSQIILRYYLNSNGVNASKVRLVSLGPEAQLDFLSAGDIDALWAYQPVATLGLQQGLKKIDGSIYNKLNVTLYSVYAFSENFLASKPELANKFFEAMMKSVQFIDENENEAKEILGRYTELGELAAEIDYLPHVEPASNEDAVRLTELTAFYQANGLLTYPITIEIVSFPLNS